MGMSSDKRPESRLSAAIRLSRWREHVPFTIPLTLAGGLLAIEAVQITADWRLFAVLAANILSMSFAFMINDIEDAPDDALNPAKKRHNVISSGALSRRQGQIIAGLAFAGRFAALWHQRQTDIHRRRTRAGAVLSLFSASFSAKSAAGH